MEVKDLQLRARIERVDISVVKETLVSA